MFFPQFFLSATAVALIAGCAAYSAGPRATATLEPGAATLRPERSPLCRRVTW